MPSKSTADDGDVSMENGERSSVCTPEQLEGSNEDREDLRHAPRTFGEQTWGAYFDIMPTDFSTPMFWSPADLQHLAGTSIADKIARDEAEADYHSKALPYIRSLPQVFLDGTGAEDHEAELNRWYSLDTYHIMGSRILSRSFHVKSRKKGLEGKTVDMDDLDSDEGEDEEDDELKLSCSKTRARRTRHRTTAHHKVNLTKLRKSMMMTTTTTMMMMMMMMMTRRGRGRARKRRRHLDDPHGRHAQCALRVG